MKASLIAIMPHAFMSVPTRFPSSCDACIHDVVADEEECLEELCKPSEGGRAAELFWMEGTLEDLNGGVNSGMSQMIDDGTGPYRIVD